MLLCSPNAKIVRAPNNHNSVEEHKKTVYNAPQRYRSAPGYPQCERVLLFSCAGRAGVSKGATLTAFPDPMPWRRCAPCVGRRLMSPCSGEHIVYPLSALISEPGHWEADGAHVSAGGGPPQCASTFGAGLLWPVLCAPVREGRGQCVHIVRRRYWHIALATCKARW